MCAFLITKVFICYQLIQFSRAPNFVSASAFKLISSKQRSIDVKYELTDGSHANTSLTTPLRWTYVKTESTKNNWRE